ncbi:MAG: hypothetical protein A2W23_06030 [Planctomycetes bacterium RBG_16_43_13]|nr:MAG: hypothetical protein A2W23_06030 [Planctomycetes bacterium RBG_16_43_13]
MLTVNLFTPTFAHDECSTAWKTSKHIRYVREQMQFDGITIFTDGLINSPIVQQVKSPIKIGWLREPECLHPQDYAQAFDNRHKFAFILTYYQPLIDTDYDKFRFAPYGGIWIKREHWGIAPKTKLVSMLYGSKMSTRGHILRHDIAGELGDNYGIDYYGFRGTPTDYSAETKRRVLQDYAFSIVTETCRQDNLFTEILLDCFAVGTVPIFWGCPNAGYFFDQLGIVPFVGVDNLRYILRMFATMKTYTEMLPYIKTNLDLVGEYEIAEDWLWDRVLKDYGVIGL